MARTSVAMPTAVTSASCESPKRERMLSRAGALLAPSPQPSPRGRGSPSLPIKWLPLPLGEGWGEGGKGAINDLAVAHANYPVRSRGHIRGMRHKHKGLTILLIQALHQQHDLLRR